MRTLTLFRHAKSSWDSPALEDFDRPLSARGRKDAPRMAAFLAERSFTPDTILCSPARRTRETVDFALPAWKPAPKIDYQDALYHASADAMLAILRDSPDEARHVMIVGHNPGLESFSARLIGGGDSSARLALARKFPTAGVAVLTFDAAHWSEATAGGGRLSIFATPKRLFSKE